MTRKSILRDILLTIITLGIWNLYVQIRQIWDTNDLLGNDRMDSFTKVVILSILTFGLYFCYHEYKLTRELHILSYGERFLVYEIGSALATFIGLWILVDSYQQALINNVIAMRDGLYIENE